MKPIKIDMDLFEDFNAWFVHDRYHELMDQKEIWDMAFEREEKKHGTFEEFIDDDGTIYYKIYESLEEEGLVDPADTYRDQVRSAYEAGYEQAVNDVAKVLESTVKNMAENLKMVE